MHHPSNGWQMIAQVSKVILGVFFHTHSFQTLLQSFLCILPFVQEAESCADRLAQASWQSYKSRPRSDGFGYFLVLRWFSKEKAWVPLFMNYGIVSSCLAKLFSTREATPICKYLSSFPHSERKLLWVKWLIDSPNRSIKGEVSASWTCLTSGHFQRSITQLVFYVCSQQAVSSCCVFY